VLGVQGDVVPAVAAAVVVGSSRSQCFSFLVTNDHFSSNWTSCVAGGKSHELVVELLGVRAGQQAVADDGVLVHADQARGLADADAFGDVAQDATTLSWGSWAPCSGVPLRSEKRPCRSYSGAGGAVGGRSAWGRSGCPGRAGRSQGSQDSGSRRRSGRPALALPRSRLSLLGIRGSSEPAQMLNQGPRACNSSKTPPSSVTSTIGFTAALRSRSSSALQGHSSGGIRSRCPRPSLLCSRRLAHHLVIGLGQQ